MKTNIEEKLQQKNIQPTAMRILVYEILQRQQKAMSLLEIEKEFDSAERSTIFRTLKTFLSKYLIHSVDDGTGAVKYALCSDDCTCFLGNFHVHFLCKLCSQTFCRNEMEVPHLQLPEGFTFEHANFVIKGICAACSAPK